MPLHKAGRNDTYQIAERPADPPPMRRALQIAWNCPECGAGICEHATSAMRGHEAEAARLREALTAEQVVSRLQKETLDAIAAGATTGAGTLESARAAASYMRLRFDRACNERDEVRSERDAVRVALGAVEAHRDVVLRERDAAKAGEEELCGALERILVRLDTIDNEDRHCACCGRDQSLGDNHKPRCEKDAARAALAKARGEEW